ncbi:MAG: BREX-1 system adenine-specific DNA-methyltransferase PglX [bacterium]
MDKETRNRIQRATQAARGLLEHEYAEQLEGVFDIRLGGTIATEPGEHLDAAQRALRTKLVMAIEHQRASGMSRADAVASYLREAAFTILNRFVALTMLEARGLVQECISRGDQSAGFKEFTGLAPGLVQLPDHGYRLYIESLFDEIGREVRVLFDRRAPASLLWPRRQALQELIEILNAPELASVWIEDETIGWAYQYFNGEDERKKMREESQAPRNSRELAVRNQFFTPRYVVQFLVDNTLGRTWFEMMRGQTGLKGLDYLVRRQHEAFLAEGEPVPGEPEGVNFGETSEHPFPVPFRAKKDPRDLKILDPACGSGHFLLYTFDLLLTIYEEAWQDEGAAASQLTGSTLRVDYSELDALRTAAPELILRHNLHGIDIDPRAAQIAALALWLRAQRAFQEAGLSREQRPAITKTNVVVAEPMPGEADLRRAFVATLEPKLGELVERVFDHLNLAGEAGYLLRITDQIDHWVRQIHGGVGGLFEQAEEREWAQAGKDLRTALETFATSAAADQAIARQLFAGDAARGLGFIDVCSYRYDIIVMNPPFGESSVGIRSLVKTLFPSSAQDIFQVFVERATELLVQSGRVGVLSARTGFFMGNSESWRKDVVWKNGLEVFTDLGLGVLDDALVEAAAYCLALRAGDNGLRPFVTRHLDTRSKQEELLAAICAFRESGTLPRCAFAPPLDVIRQLPAGVFAYWAPASYLERFLSGQAFADAVSPVRQGVATADDFRFVRLRWEVPETSLSERWHLFSKGGEYSPPFDDIHLVVDWDSDGRCLKSLESARVQNTAFYHRPGVTYTVRTASAFAAKILPEGCIFSHNAQSWFHKDRDVLLASAFYFLCRAPQAFIELAVGGGDVSTSGSAARRYTTAVVHSVPADAVAAVRLSVSEGGSDALLEAKAHELSLDETSLLFSGVRLGRGQGVADAASAIAVLRQRRVVDALQCAARIDRAVSNALELTPAEQQFVEEEIGPHVCEYPDGDADPDDIARLVGLGIDQLVAVGLERVGAKRWITKKSYFVDRRTELICHIAKCHPRDVLCAVERAQHSAGDLAPELLSHLVGIALGRWKQEVFGRGETWKEFVRDPFKRPDVGAMLAGLQPRVSSILVDDLGASADLGGALAVAIKACWPGCDSDAILAELGETLDCGDDGIRAWLRSNFFGYHLGRYSKSRRKAPIYWQLATTSASYSAWLYYHRFTRDTLFRLLSDHVVPKLQHEERKLTNLTQDAGPNPAGSQRKEVEAQETFVGELRAFRDEVARVAPLWNPNLDDGVLLNFAPLWRLVPQHKAWQKECRSAWDKLCKGDYDWAHLAMHLWPERVVPKCAEDRNLAMAHGVEDVFWCEDEDGKWQPRRVSQREVDELVKERTSAAVKDALKGLLEAPAPETGRAGRKKAPRANGVRKKTASTRPRAATSGSSLPNRSAESVDAGLLSKVKDAIGANGTGASRADVIDATGISGSDWNKAIKALLADGSVKRTGERRGARYHLAGGEA